MVAPNSRSDEESRTVLIRIKRQEGPGKSSRWEEFDVPFATGANIISCLQWIAANPRTVEGENSTPVVYDSGCLEEVCGACTMVINGTVRQSCTALIENIIDSSNTITLEPMSSFPVIRDLAVDRARLFKALEQVRAWVPIDGTYDLGAGPMESPKTQLTRYQLSQCMSCGCCLEACPQFNLEEKEEDWKDSFIGPQAISQARYFNLHETGQILADERVDAISGMGGVGDCGNAQNCVKVCPKEIPLTESIAAMGRAVTVRTIRKFFTG